jgi:hypothetical protein
VRQTASRQLLFLEFNEINFESLEFYCRRGLLPHLGELIRRNGWAQTSSELQYAELEPWIQWVTAHTGRSLSEHGIYRLGDIVRHDLPQIWERLEDHGLRVGAISPMNAKHRVRSPAFFVPDPWTSTDITAGTRLRNLYAAIAQAVNDNAQGRLQGKSIFHLLVGLASYARVANYAHYVKMAASSPSRPWRRAILLDQLLADVFVTEVARTEPHFATLFLNAGAHIQHHYMFSGACYAGPHRNPDWYISAGLDPVMEVYEAYDRIYAAVRAKFPEARVMIATGLHQDPHGEVTFYWRLRDHPGFLRRIGVPFVRVEPRMSRDFLISCESPAQALAAQARLASAVATDGTALFEIDNRGTDLFVMLTYPHEIGPDFAFQVGQQHFSSLEHDVAFVALKNGEHNGLGYFLDTHMQFPARTTTFELKEIPARIMEAFGISETARVRGAA